MIIGRATKKIKRLIVSIFFILPISLYTNVIYAFDNPQLTITNLASYSEGEMIEKESTTPIPIITVSPNKKYKISFLDIDDIIPTEFVLSDSKGNNTPGNINEVKCNKISPKVCTVTADFAKANQMSPYKTFHFKASDDKGNSIQTAGNLPELTFALNTKYKNSEESYTLKLTNNSSKPIQILETLDSDFLNKLKIEKISNPITINPNESHELGLSMDKHCSNINGSALDNITIKYAILDQVQVLKKMEVSVEFRLSCEILDNTLPPFLFSEKMKTYETITAEYPITNPTNNEVSLNIQEPEPPIYQDYYKNPTETKPLCGTSLGAKKTCILKLFMYPTTPGDITQKITVSSNDSSMSLPSIYIDTEVKDDKPPLQITLEDNLNPVKSIYPNLDQIKEDGLLPLQLKYKLTNNSKNTLNIDTDIKNIYVGSSNILWHDKRFHINIDGQAKSNRLSLEPSSSRIINVTFTPDSEEVPRWKDSSQKMGLKRFLIIKFLQESPEEKKVKEAAEMPIFITN